MKWFKRTAQGFSPGSLGAKHALKASPTPHPGVQFGTSATLRYSSTPTLRSPGIEDEDDDEDEYEAIERQIQSILNRTIQTFYPKITPNQEP